MNLKITSDDIEYLEMIQKENSILILNKNEMLKFYYQFYSCIENKNKEVKISIGEKILDSRNTI